MRVAAVAAIVCLTLFNFSAVTNAQAAVRKQTNIPAQGLGPALQSLAKEHEFQIIYRSELLKDLRTQGAAGDLTSDEAMAQLLSGTGLAYRYLDEKTITVFAPTSGNTGAESLPKGRQSSSLPSASELRLAQAEPVTPNGIPAEASDDKKSNSVKSQDLPAPEERGKAIPEILVKGKRRIGNLNVGRSRLRRWP